MHIRSCCRAAPHRPEQGGVRPCAPIDTTRHDIAHHIWLCHIMCRFLGLFWMSARIGELATSVRHLAHTQQGLAPLARMHSRPVSLLIPSPRHRRAALAICRDGLYCNGRYITGSVMLWTFDVPKVYNQEHHHQSYPTVVSWYPHNTNA